MFLVFLTGASFHLVQHGISDEPAVLSTACWLQYFLCNAPCETRPILLWNISFGISVKNPTLLIYRHNSACVSINLKILISAWFYSRLRNAPIPISLRFWVFNWVSNTSGDLGNFNWIRSIFWWNCLKKLVNWENHTFKSDPPWLRGTCILYTDAKGLRYFCSVQYQKKKKVDIVTKVWTFFT